MLKQKSSVPPCSINREQAPDLYSLRRPVEPGAISHHSTIHQIKTNPERDFFLFGEGRVDVVAQLCMVVGWCIDHPEYAAKIKVLPKKDHPVLMPCEF